MYLTVLLNAFANSAFLEVVKYYYFRLIIYLLPIFSLTIHRFLFDALFLGLRRTSCFKGLHSE